MKYQELFDLAAQKGIESLELYEQTSESIQIGLFRGEIDTYEISKLKTISVRGIYQGQMGYASSEKFEKGMEKELVDAVISNAKVITTKDIGIIYAGDKEYKQVNVYNPDLHNVPMTDKIKLLKNVEKAVYALNPAVSEVADNVYEESNVEVEIFNNLGLSLHRKNNYVTYYIDVVVKAPDGTSKDGMALRITNKFEDLKVDEIAKEAVDEAMSKIGAAPIKSGSYKVVINNKMMASLLGVIVSSTYASNVQRGYSIFKDKIGKKIACPLVTIVEDPLMENSLSSCGFDDEGVATYKKTIVDKGELEMFLYNLKTAKKDGVKSSGNGYKHSVTSSVDIDVSNTYLEPGITSFEDLLKGVGDGVLITSLQGMHSGLDAVSGNFSLQASGFVIKNGVKEKPINLITVAGNLYTMLNNIEMVGSDLGFNFSPSMKAPSVVVNGLVISGK